MRLTAACAAQILGLLVALVLVVVVGERLEL
jgi:hypothetical protein